jgi:hypothetical protein
MSGKGQTLIIPAILISTRYDQAAIGKTWHIYFSSF